MSVPRAGGSVEPKTLRSAYGRMVFTNPATSKSGRPVMIRGSARCSVRPLDAFHGSRRVYRQTYRIRCTCKMTYTKTALVAVPLFVLFELGQPSRWRSKCPAMALTGLLGRDASAAA